MSSSGVPVDPARVLRHVESPHQVGVINIKTSSRSANRGRWYYQAEWSAFTRRRLLQHIDAFDSHSEFVEFAIEAASIRRLPPPNFRGRLPKAEQWAQERILGILHSLLRGRNGGSLTLQFFNAALDELEGIGATRSGQPFSASGAAAAGVEVVETADPVEFEVDEEEEIAYSGELAELRARYVLMLILKAEEYDGLPPDELLDRIERFL